MRKKNRVIIRYSALDLMQWRKRHNIKNKITTSGTIFTSNGEQLPEQNFCERVVVLDVLDAPMPLNEASFTSLVRPLKTRADEPVDVVGGGRKRGANMRERRPRAL